jgi:hypothetical protein
VQYTVLNNKKIYLEGTVYKLEGTSYILEGTVNKSKYG